MIENRELAEDLGGAFTVRQARQAGDGRGRMRGWDLGRPFHGVRTREHLLLPADAPDARDDRVKRRARAYAPKLAKGQFFSHSTAAALWGAPVPLSDERIHVSTIGNGSLSRTAGVVGHRIAAELADPVIHDGLPVASPAATWAACGSLSIVDLVILGDYLCRVWRAGYGRPNVGRRPLATTEQLRTALESGRRLGAARLRSALPLIRTDSWSPRESLSRYVLVEAGLPEPRLNIDVWDDSGSFLGCIDLAYPEWRIAIEYQGRMHSASYASDIERIERLRAAGWIVIQVTSALLANRIELVRRVRAAIRSRASVPYDE